MNGNSIFLRLAVTVFIIIIIIIIIIIHFIQLNHFKLQYANNLVIGYKSLGTVMYA